MAPPTKRRAPKPATPFVDPLVKTFEDPVSLQDVPMSEGLMLNKKMYAKESIRQLAARGMRGVPHSRRRMTEEELLAAMDTPMDREGAAEIRALVSMGVVAVAQDTIEAALARAQALVGPRNLNIGTREDGSGFIVFGSSYAIKVEAQGGRVFAKFPLGPVIVLVKRRAVMDPRMYRGLNVKPSVMVQVTKNPHAAGGRLAGWTRYEGLNGMVAKGMDDAMALIPPMIGIEPHENKSKWSKYTGA